MIVFPLYRDNIVKDYPPVYEKGYFKCVVEGCGKTIKKGQYASHRGGVHWQGVVDRYLSERGKDINVDGDWPDNEIQMMWPTSYKKAKGNDSNTMNDSPMASTPKNGTVKKRGRPQALNPPDVPNSPATKKRLKDITVRVSPSNIGVGSKTSRLSVRFVPSNFHEQREQAPSHM